MKDVSLSRKCANYPFMMIERSAPAFESALARILRPIVKLLLQRGLRYGRIQALMKALLVSEAVALSEHHSQKPTDSRISILTGLQRKDVKALRSEETSIAPPSMGPLPRLIAAWTSEPMFLGRDHAPLPLPRIAEPNQPSFELLCRRITQDVHPRTLLEEIARGVREKFA